MVNSIFCYIEELLDYYLNFFQLPFFFVLFIGSKSSHAMPHIDLVTNSCIL